MSTSNESRVALEPYQLPARALARSLHLIGWELLALDIDLSNETARINLRCNDLYVTFDAQNGRASITRERLRREIVRVGRRGDSFMAERLRPEFIGRKSGLGLRSGLRELSYYVADNAPALLTHQKARELFRPILALSAPLEPA